MLKSKKVAALLISLAMTASMATPNIAAAADDIKPTEPFKVACTDMSPAVYGTVEGNNFNSSSSMAPYKSAEMNGMELRSTTGTPDGDVPAGNAPYLKYTNGTAFTPTPYGESNGFMFLYSPNRVPNCNEGEIFVNEFDLKFDTNTDALLWYASYIPLWGENRNTTETWTLFGGDGKLKGTDYSYPVGEWFHIKLRYNDSTGMFNVTVTDKDGAHDFSLHRNARNYGWVPNNGRMALSLCQLTEKEDGQETAGVAFDNFKIYKEIMPSDGYIISPSGSYKSLKSVKLSASAVNADSVKFYVDDTEIETFTAPDKAQYTYTTTADLSSFSAGTHCFKVVKLNGKAETKLSESFFSYTPYFQSKISVIAPQSWQILSGYVARVEEYNTDSEGNIIAAEENAMKIAWYPEGTYNFDDGNFLYKRLWSYTTRGNSDVTLNRQDVGRSGADGDYSGSFKYKNTNNSASDANGFIMTYGNEAYNTLLSRDGGILSIEFDVSLGTTEDAFGLNLPLWHDSVAGQPGASSAWIFGPDGKIAGTEVPYSANQWMHLKMEYDFDNNLWNVWLTKDGEPEEHIVTDTPAATGIWNFADKKWDRTMYLLHQIGTKTTDEAGNVVNPAYVKIDNYSQKRFEKIPSFSLVSYTEEDDTALTASELKISDKADKAILTLDRDMDEILSSDVSLKINGEEKDKNVTFDKASKKITVSLPADIKDGDKIDISLLGTAKAHKIENNKILEDGTHETISIEIGQPVSVSLNVVSSDIFIKSFSVDGSNASAEIWNGSGADIENAVLVVAGFNGTRLASVSYTSIASITTGSNKYNVNMSADCTDLTTKVFLWGGNGDKFMQPLETK